MDKPKFRFISILIRIPVQIRLIKNLGLNRINLKKETEMAGNSSNSLGIDPNKLCTALEYILKN